MGLMSGGAVLMIQGVSLAADLKRAMKAGGSMRFRVEEHITGLSRGEVK